MRPIENGLAKIRKDIAALRARRTIAWQIAESPDGVAHGPFPDTNDPQPMTRRRFLGLTAGAAAGTGLVGAGLWRPWEQGEQNTHTDFKDGEVIPHPLEPKVNGWGVDINAVTLIAYAKANPDTIITMSLSGLPPKGPSGHHEAQLSAKHDFGERVGFNPDLSYRRSVLADYDVARVKQPDGTYMSLRTLPGDTSDFAVLQISETIIDDTEPPQVSKFVIRMHADHFQGSGDAHAHVYSEGAIPQQSMESLANMVDSFSVVNVGTSIYIVDTERHPGGSVPVLDTYSTIVESADIIDPEYSGQAETGLSHVLFHKLINHMNEYSSYEDKPNITTAIAGCKTTHDILMDHIKAEVANMTENKYQLSTRALHHPVLSIFDDIQMTEAMRVNQIQRAHYPYPVHADFFDFKVLFASAMTTFRYYPREFAHAFQQLTPEQKGVVRDFAESSLAIVDARIEDINTSGLRIGSIQTLIPEHDLIRTALTSV